VGFIQLALIAVGLSMDAFAVSICKGLRMKKIDKRYMFLLAGFFGFFQGLMPLIGWFLGSRFQKYITNFDHWIAFTLLVLIGGKMIYESCTDAGDNCKIGYDLKEVLMLSIATSIDALAVGLTFAFLNMKNQIVGAILLIGGITFLLSLLGVLVGHRFGSKYKRKAEFAGGIILVLIGTKILFEHLGIFSF